MKNFVATLRHKVLVCLEDFHGDARDCSPLSFHVSCGRKNCVCLLEMFPPLDLLLIIKVLKHWGTIF
jgi:hypothetical protein